MKGEKTTLKSADGDDEESRGHHLSSSSGRLMDGRGRTKGLAERTSPVNIAHNYNYQDGADCDDDDDDDDSDDEILLKVGMIVCLRCNRFVTTSKHDTK